MTMRKINILYEFMEPKYPLHCEVSMVNFPCIWMLPSCVFCRKMLMLMCINQVGKCLLFSYEEICHLILNWIELNVYLFLKTVEQSKQFEHEQIWISRTGGTAARSLGAWKVHLIHLIFWIPLKQGPAVHWLPCFDDVEW